VAWVPVEEGVSSEVETNLISCPALTYPDEFTWHLQAREGVESAADRTRFDPQRAGLWHRIDSNFLPPCGFVAMPMDLAMMSTAQWNREFITDLAAKCSALGKA
jgi:hypothetical protein